MQSEDAKITYTIIMPVYNNLEYTTQAINALFLHTQDFEMIVINNGSHDGTAGYLDDVAKRVDPKDLFRVIHNDKNKGFAASINQGLELARGTYIIIINNDVLVTPKWADRMVHAKENLQDVAKTGPIGIIGPASNYVAGRQAVPDIKYDLRDLANVAERFYKANKGNYMLAGYLSGFCLMIHRDVIENIGVFDERFGYGGFEDNDFLLRAKIAGWNSMIAGDVFIHHYGSRTIDFDQFKHLRRGVANRPIFYNKWKKLNTHSKKKKLVAIYRAKNLGDKEYFKWSLKQTQTFADDIIVLCDNCTDDTAAVANKLSTEECPIHVTEKNEKFNERDDRNDLIVAAKALHADWIISIDGDEVFEDKFDRDYVQRLMNPLNPEVFCYGFSWYTFFNGITHWRVDGIFGRMRGWRMFRNIPEDKYQKIVMGTEIGLHCGNIPAFAPEYCRWTSVRIKHFGYSDPAECERKKALYERLDQEKDESLIGAQDYAHLTPERMMVKKWIPKNILSFAVMVCDNEEAALLSDLLEMWNTMVDEVVIVCTNPKAEEVKKMARLYTDKVYDFKWNNDFSAARNFMKSKCTGQWIMTMDPDETFAEFGPIHITKMTEMDCDGYMFSVKNIQKNNVWSVSEAVRLFKNIPEFKYTGRVHENFDTLLRKKIVRILPSPLKIDHYGYLKSDEQMEGKLLFYEKLNRIQIKENPKDARPYFNLALHYRNEGNVERAKTFITKAIKLDPKFVNAMKEMGFLLFREGLEWFKYAQKALPKTHVGYEGIEILIDKIEGLLGPEEIYVGKARQKMMERFKAIDTKDKDDMTVEEISSPGADDDNKTKMAFVPEQKAPVEV